MSIFDEWDKTMDTDGLKKDIAEAKENGTTGNYKEVPVGTYDVKITKIELTASKKGKLPMLSVWFKIQDGEYKGSMLFMNQLIDEGWKIGNAESFLESLETSVNVTFDNYNQFNQVVLDVFEETGSMNFDLKYGKNKSGYNTFQITGVYDD